MHSTAQASVEAPALPSAGLPGGAGRQPDPLSLRLGVHFLPVIRCGLEPCLHGLARHLPGREPAVVSQAGDSGQPPRGPGMGGMGVPGRPGGGGFGVACGGEDGILGGRVCFISGRG